MASIRDIKIRMESKSYLALSSVFIQRPILATRFDSPLSFGILRLVLLVIVLCADVGMAIGFGPIRVLTEKWNMNFVEGPDAVMNLLKLLVN